MSRTATQRSPFLAGAEASFSVALDLDAVQRQVAGWFTRDSLRELLNASGSRSGGMTLDWVALAGKRRRPFLAAAMCCALGDASDGLPPGLRRLGVAVECFHKASLIHDDIEDGDELRYGEMTLHCQYGVPIALNLGDLLIGDGYLLIASCDASAECRALMLRIASEGHRNLALGQGEELLWTRQAHPPAVEEVLAVFRLKTAPAFEVALLLGAHYAGASDAVCTVLRAFSRALGVAYQIRDDLDDAARLVGADGPRPVEPSLLFALAYEQASEPVRAELAGMWRRRRVCARDAARLAAILDELRVETRAKRLLEHYRDEAIRSCDPLDRIPLKHLLQRIAARMLSHA